LLLAPAFTAASWNASTSAWFFAIGDERKARKALKKLIELAPEAPLVSVALGNYDCGVYSHQVKGECPAAPQFAVKALDGTTFDLTSLKGKVVVLNFWFIGCAPCRVEMPHLNALVKEFKPNQDVVFIGNATDGAKHLKQFLAKTTFNYHIVADGAQIASKYGVGAYPTHIVIAKDGTISSQSIGGSTDIDTSLRLRINRALAGI